MSLGDFLRSERERRDEVAADDASIIKQLTDRGYTVLRDDPIRARQVNAHVRADTRRWEGGRVSRFGVISCTHLGSYQQQLTALREFYDRIQDLGIDTVFHLGDLFDGDGHVYRGHQYEVRIVGADRQLEYGVSAYPERQGVRTKVIAGNHDWSFFQRGGFDIVKAFADKRPDVDYLGPIASPVLLDVDEHGRGLKLLLRHAKGGQAYARSYRMQKHIEQFAPEVKPEMYLMGNFHSFAHLPMYRNVYAWQVGCFQSQTNFEAALGLYPEIGGLIVEVHHSTLGADSRDADNPGHGSRVSVAEISYRFLPWFVPRQNDF